MPKAFRTDSYIHDIKGVYAPFWLYDAHADAQAYFHGTKVKSWSDDKYNYTKTSHYRLYRNG